MFDYRLMNPDDANVFGNVHGGSILQFIDEAGAILVTKYCNSGQVRGTQTIFVTKYCNTGQVR